MSKDTPVQPKLADLLAGYLNRQAEAQAAGLSHPELEAGTEAVAYDAGTVHTVEPKLAWEETLVVARCFVPSLKTQDWQLPPGWASLVAAHEPVVAVACAFGNFPQMVRHFHTILQSRNFSSLRPGSGTVRPASAPAVVDWAGQMAKKAVEQSEFPLMLAAVGTLRLAKEFDQAEQLFKAHDAAVPASLRPAWDNERAALAWHRGQAQQAVDIWQKLDPSAVVLFNRGMAELFHDRPTPAQASLKAAVTRLPEEGAWHHLGRLYLTLAQSR